MTFEADKAKDTANRSHCMRALRETPACMSIGRATAASICAPMTAYISREHTFAGATWNSWARKALHTPLRLLCFGLCTSVLSDSDCDPLER